jgi:hypothetical protein
VAGDDGWVNLAGLLPAADRLRGVDVLNGIASMRPVNGSFVIINLGPGL